MSEPKAYRESHLRSILKGLTWRVLATLTTIFIAWFFLNDVETALQIGLVEFFLKFFVYYAHERIWQLVPRGTVRKAFTKE